MRSLKKLLVSLFVFIFAFSGCPMTPLANLVGGGSSDALAATGDSINLGTFVKTLSNGTYTGTGKFSNATGSGSTKYSSLVVSVTAANSSGSIYSTTISLPTVSGYSYQSSLSSDYSKVVNLSTAKTASQIASEYISKVSFTCSSGQKVSVVLSNETTNNKVAYYSANDHYYMYVSGETPWTTAYDTAKSMTYMGRKGYLATITSYGESEFVYNVTGGARGWYGGTSMPRNNGVSSYDLASSDKKVSDLFSDTTASGVWIWACGPEAGWVINASGTRSYSGNGWTNGYGNYVRWKSDEPNSASCSYGTENCLTTIDTSPKEWNDFYSNNYGNEYSANKASGYVVEFGDQQIGDSGSSAASSSTTQISATGTIPSELPSWATAAGLSDSNCDYDAVTGKITITDDVTLTKAIEIPSGETSFTIDLNGHTVTGSDTDAAIKTTGVATNLTITDSSEAGTGAIVGGKGQAAIDASSITGTGVTLTITGGVTITGGAGADATDANGDGGNGAAGIIGSSNLGITVDSGSSVTGGAGGKGNGTGNGGNGGAGISTAGSVTATGSVSGGEGGLATGTGTGGTGGDATSGVTSVTGATTGGAGGDSIGGTAGTGGKGQDSSGSETTGETGSVLFPDWAKEAGLEVGKNCEVDAGTGELKLTSDVELTKSLVIPSDTTYTITCLA